MTAERVERPRAVGPGRRPELDAIRILVVVGPVFFHSALVFDTDDDFYVKNTDTTDATKIAAGLAVVWAMPMLFLIAGLGSWHSLRRRRPAGFATERLRARLCHVVSSVRVMPRQSGQVPVSSTVCWTSA
jgi:peptidoglycan/LPS O-acetylase OafA/YrhL